MPLTAALIIISFSSPALSFKNLKDLKPFFRKSFPLQPFFFFSTDYMIPQTSTVTSGIGCFYFLVFFLFYNF